LRASWRPRSAFGVEPTSVRASLVLYLRWQQLERGYSIRRRQSQPQRPRSRGAEFFLIAWQTGFRFRVKRERGCSLRRGQPTMAVEPVPNRTLSTGGVRTRLLAPVSRRPRLLARNVGQRQRRPGGRNSGSPRRRRVQTCDRLCRSRDEPIPRARTIETPVPVAARCGFSL